MGRARGTQTAPTASTAPRPGTRSTPSTRRRRRSAGSLHVGHVFSLHPHRHDRPLPAHAGRRGLLPDGLGRQRPAHRAAGPELLRRPLRPLAPLRPRLPAAGRAAQATARRPSHLPAQLRRAVRPAHRRGRAGLRGAVAPPRAVGRLVADLRHHRRPRPAHQPAGLPAQPGPGRGLPGRGARRSGTSRFQTAVAQAELEDREQPGAYHRIAFHRGDGGDPSSSRPPGPSCIPACVALVAHPDDERYQPLFGTDGPHAALRRRGPGPGPRARRPREGLAASP